LVELEENQRKGLNQLIKSQEMIKGKFDRKSRQMIFEKGDFILM
jgi:hypothetical protein